jgi:hypothetical protein
VRRRGLLILGLLPLLGLAAWAVWPSPPRVPDWSGEYDVTSRPPELIPPGTVIDRSPPPGWSHLVIKSLPHVRPADRDKVHGLTVRMVSWMFTAFVADVRPDPAGGRRRYHLHSVAMGLGTSVEGRDTILSPETRAQLGANLGFLQRLVLSGAYQTQGGAQVIARSRTTAFVDAAARLLRHGKHRPVTLRYALLADERTGALETLMWLLDREGGGYQGPSSPVRRLPPNLIEYAVLHVDGNEFTLGLPTDRAFAAAELPPAREQFPFAEEMKAPAARPLLSPADARRLDAWLRKLVASKR